MAIADKTVTESSKDWTEDKIENEAEMRSKQCADCTRQECNKSCPLFWIETPDVLIYGVFAKVMKERMNADLNVLRARQKKNYNSDIEHIIGHIEWYMSFLG